MVFKEIISGPSQYFGRKQDEETKAKMDRGEYVSPDRIESYTQRTNDANKKKQEKILKQQQSDYKKNLESKRKMESALNSPHVSDELKNQYRERLANTNRLIGDYESTLVKSKPDIQDGIDYSDLSKDKAPDQPVKKEEATPAPSSNAETKTETKTEPKTTSTPGTNLNSKISIVDLLKSKGQASSYDDRKKLAQSYGIENYEGTKEQNSELIKKVAKADAKVLAERIKTGLANGTITQDQAREGVEKIKKITDAADKKSKEELAIDKRTEEIKEENKGKVTNVSKDKLSETQDEYKKNVEDANKEAADKITEAAGKESEAIEEKNKEAEQRVEDREENLQEKFDEFEGNVEQRRQDIANNTQRTKNIASRSANIASAVAGQAGQSLSDGEILSIQNDILRDYDTNISAAEQAEIKSNTELDQALRDTGIAEFQNQETIDKFKDSLDNEANAPLIAAIKKVLEGDTKAIEDVTTFLNSSVAKTAQEQSDRANRINRISENEEQYEQSTPEERVALLKDLTKGQAGAEFIGDEIRELVLEYPDLSLAEIQAKVEKEAAYLNQRNIIANTISGKTYEDLGDDEKKAVDGLLKRGQDSQDRSDNSVEDTDAQKAELDAAQETAEEKKAREQAEKEAEEAAKAEAEAQALREKFNGFKDKKTQDTYNKTRKALQEKLKAQVERIKKLKDSNPEKYKSELARIEQLGKEGIKKLNAYKEKNSI